MAQLAWFADVEGYRAAAGRESTRHYRYHWRPRRGGAPRLLEAPKPMLKGIQRQILHGILDPVPVHDAAHGFRRGRSCLTAAQRHAGEEVLLSLDLKDFFLSVPLRQVHGLFRSLGYPWAVARVLTGLCSTATPADVLAGASGNRDFGQDARGRLRQAHLPQGAPTSPALANLCAWRLDCRLDGLARACGAIRECPTGEARITPGFDLPAKHVIHAVGPVWRGGGEKEPALLASCYYNSLELARESGLTSIAFPAISTGIYGFPLDQATEIAVSEVESWLADEKTMERVIFAVFGEDVERAYRDRIGL